MGCAIDARPDPRAPRLDPCRATLACAATFAAVLSGAAHASESGASLYLLGSAGPGAAIMPPLQGVFLDNTAYFYSGSGGGGAQFKLGGNLVAGLKGEVPADFLTLLWVPTTDFLGGTLGLGAALPFGDPNVHVNAVITGPLGRQLSVSASDSAFIVADPILTGLLGWKTGAHTYVQASTTLNIPAGEYRNGKLANLAFHRWADDLSLAATWRDPASGWDVTGKLGVTFNGRNEATDYTTGTESHYEVSAAKILSPSWTVAAQAYYFDQLSGDSGPGATLGAFKGRVGGVGGMVDWNVKAGRIPLAITFRAMHEFDARNRLEGDSIWLDITLPLHVKLPAGAPHE